MCVSKHSMHAVVVVVVVVVVIVEVVLVVIVVVVLVFYYLYCVLLNVACVHRWSYCAFKALRMHPRHRIICILRVCIIGLCGRCRLWQYSVQRSLEVSHAKIASTSPKSSRS